ncbi:C-C motif chemokine 1 [Echinops telfairi]|uniref:C-C motif chemokine n=1 Tax=Echinops telfairi TaxID=9371 RepID=A0ABM0ITN1_ECHTE|nr:C-C motif chemokine 1 [Echinops telfairi]
MTPTTVVLVCLLLAGMWTRDGDSKSIHLSSSNCCFHFVNRAIPWRSIQCYRKTSSTCAYKNALILKLKRGQENCVLKTARWVQHHLNRTKPCLPKGE